MSHFEVFAHGELFEPDAFLASTTLQFDGKWYKGGYGDNHPKSSGVRKRLGDGQLIPLPKQEQIAIDFLKANRDALKALAQFPGVTTFILGLQYHVELDETIAGFCM